MVRIYWVTDFCEKIAFLIKNTTRAIDEAHLIRWSLSRQEYRHLNLSCMSRRLFFPSSYLFRPRPNIRNHMLGANLVPKCDNVQYEVDEAGSRGKLSTFGEPRLHPFCLFTWNSAPRTSLSFRPRTSGPLLWWTADGKYFILLDTSSSDQTSWVEHPIWIGLCIAD